jgi:hypothetical protein
MADFGINPNIAMGFQGNPANKPMTLNELVGLSRNVMETSRLAELYPELIRKTQAETKSAETNAAKSAMELNLAKVKSISDGQISMIMNPLVIEAEANPEKVDRKALVNLVTQNAMMQSKNLGIDYEKEGKELARPYIEMAENNPGNLLQFFKERHMAGLDAASRATAFAEGKGVGVSTLPRRSPTGVTSEQMTAPIRGQDLTVAPVTENRVDISAIPGSATQMAQGPVQGQAQGQAQARMPVGQMVQLQTTNYPLIFDVPERAGIQRPRREGETKAIEFGQTLRDQLAERQVNMTKAREDVANVIRSANDLINKKGFIPETGAGGELRRKYASLIGDPTYQELEKNLAQVVSSNLAALKVGGNSVAGLELTKEAAGKLGYDPTVLLKIARRADADLTNIDMMATALQKHSQRFGDANAQRFTKMWSDNADSKVFQIMNIYRDIEDPKLREAAAAEIVKDRNESQREVLTKKFQRIVELTETGDLRR